MLLNDLLITTKDGDWGSECAQTGFVPYRVIRGADFPTLRAGDNSSVPIRFLDSGTVERRTLQPNDIIIETAGGNHDRPTGRTLLITDKTLLSFDLPVTCASFCRFLRVNPDKADPRFVFWYLQSLYEQGEMWQHQVQHTGVARFQYTRFARSIDIPIPSPREQNAIAETLGALESKIVLNRYMNETLEAMARAIFKSWFVDFDPVRAKSQGGQPFGIDAETAALLPSHFQNSAIGRIPEGWQVERPKSFCQICIGGDWGEDDPFDDSVQVVCLRGVDLERLRKDGYAAAPLRWVKQASLAKRRIRDSDILIAASGIGPVGKSLKVTGEMQAQYGNPVIYSNFCKRLEAATPEHATYFDRWLYEMHRSNEIWDYVNGTSIPNLDANGLVSQMLIVVPPRPLLSRYHEFAAPIYARLFNQESRTLSTIRDALLPELISGEIRIKDAEKMVGEKV